MDTEEKCKILNKALKEIGLTLTFIANMSAAFERVVLVAPRISIKEAPNKSGQMKRWLHSTEKFKKTMDSLSFKPIEYHVKKMYELFEKHELDIRMYSIENGKIVEHTYLFSNEKFVAQ